MAEINLPFMQGGVTYNLYKMPKKFVIKGNLNLSGLGLTELPDLSDVIVEGDFCCNNNRLTSLKGAPKGIGGDFMCLGNQLTSLAEISQMRKTAKIYCEDSLAQKYGYNKGEFTAQKLYDNPIYIKERAEKIEQNQEINVGKLLTSARRRVFNKIRNNWGKLLVGGVAVTTLQMCEMSPQEKDEFKQNYTELRAQENRAVKRTYHQNAFLHWNKEYNDYMKEKGLSFEEPFSEERISKGRLRTRFAITDKEGTEVGWVEKLERRGKTLNIDIFAFNDKNGNADLLEFVKKADYTREEEWSLLMQPGEKIKNALERKYELVSMKMFHPFLSRQCEQNI